MGEPAIERKKYTFAEYLELDRKSELKLEYYGGEIYPLGEILAMGGGTIEHGRLGGRVLATLTNLLGGRRCEVFPSDVRIRVLATGFTAYPDVSVVCGKIETAPEDPETITNPVLLVEVLSKSTERYDRGTKAEQYREIPSLREYLLVSQKDQAVEHCVRNADGSWALRVVRSPDVVHLAIGGEIDVAKLFQRTAQG